MRLKILHKLLLRAFVGPFIATFFVVQFILIMQFLWKYIDDLVGKGLEITVIAKLVFYASFTFVPMALPLAILLSTIMTFGNLGEFNELTTVKSSGVSLLRFMRPLLIVNFGLVVFAFFFSNNILPKANLKFQTLLYDIREQKPTLSIKEGVFYGGLDGYVIKVGKKSADGNTLYKILIYDHSEHRGNSKVIYAEQGKMEMLEKDHFLVLTLKNGYMYDELRSKPNSTEVHPETKTYFKEQRVGFDLSAFKFSRTKEDLFKDVYTMLTIQQLNEALDSLEFRGERRIKEVATYQDKYYSLVADSAIKSSKKEVGPVSITNWKTTVPPALVPMIYQEAKNSTSGEKAYLSMQIRDNDFQSLTIAQHLIEWNRKFTLSVAIIVLFLIGAPLGAIIKKGGFGMPLLMSIVFFLVYHVLSMIGEKMAEQAKLMPSTGMWLSTIVLLPIGLFLMFQANSDSTIFDLNQYKQFFKRLIRK